MIRLGLRFCLRGAREGKIRMILTTLGISLAVALLLFTISGFSAFSARDQRNGWLATSDQNKQPSVDERQSAPMWWQLSYDSYQGKSIAVVEVAATGSGSPVVPGLERNPSPGEYYVSPALGKLLDSAPADLLKNRFSGSRAGILGNRILASPDSLVIIEGRSVTEMQKRGLMIRSIETAPKQHDYSSMLRLALGVGAIGLMLPILIFVVTATRLAAARREERLAALRLIGATPRQVTVIAIVEIVLAALAGTVLGFVFFFVFRPLVAMIPFTGERFFSQDLSLGWLVVVGVALGVPLAAVVVSLLTLRRVQVSPLGVSRKAPAGRPSAWRLLIPGSGVAFMLALDFGPVGDHLGSTFRVYVVFAWIGLGIMMAGPWFTYLSGRLLGAFARRDSTLIAARRLGSDSRRAFRAISGLVLAVFVGTVFVSIVAAAMYQDGGGLGKRNLPSSTVVGYLDIPGGKPGNDGADAAKLIAPLKRLSGVKSVVPVLQESTQSSNSQPSDPEAVRYLVSNQDWKVLGGSGRDVVGGSGYVAVLGWSVVEGYLRAEQPSADIAGGTGDVPARTEKVTRKVAELMVLTDGKQASVDRVRTIFRTASPTGWARSVGELNAQDGAELRILGRMINVGVILCLIIAGCSLAVSVASGMVERKRAFALLRLAGLPLGRLYRVVLIEALVPLVLGAVVSGLAGFFVAAMIILSAGSGRSIAAPSPGYFVMIAGGLAAAMAVVAATLPLVGRMTDPGNVRME